MTVWAWIRIGVAFAIPLVAIKALDWISDFVFREGYPAELAIDIEGFDGPLVNRATLQRSWPEGLEELPTRAQFRAHMAALEHMTPPPASAGTPTVVAAEPEPDFATLLAAADIAAGERRARVCAACHSFDEGGRDGVGPNLWAVVGRDVASRSSFNYSEALANEPGGWTLDKLDAYLTNPGKAIPGNKMAFQGIRRAGDRAEVIAYLRMQGSSHVPLPQAASAGSAINGGEDPS